jgi:hypothetical protein
VAHTILMGSFMQAGIGLASSSSRDRFLVQIRSSRVPLALGRLRLVSRITTRGIGALKSPGNVRLLATTRYVGANIHGRILLTSGRLCVLQFAGGRAHDVPSRQRETIMLSNPQWTSDPASALYRTVPATRYSAPEHGGMVNISTCMCSSLERAALR